MKPLRKPRSFSLPLAAIASLGAAAVLGAVGVATSGSASVAFAGEGAATKATADRATTEVAKDMDRVIAEAWTTERLTAGKLCTDEEFVRRIHFDLVGTPPTALQVEDFLKDPSPHKREKLVEALLATPGYARHFANLWAEVLVGVGNDDAKRDFVPSTFMPWLESQLATARPWGEVITDLLAADGSSYSNPAVNFTARVAFTPTDLAGLTSKAFLGVQIQCAQCHDHPYEDITQAEFQSFSAFWGRIRLKPADIPYEMFGPRAVEAEQRRMQRDVAEAMKNGVPQAEAELLAARKKQRTKEVSDISGDVRLPKALAEGRMKLLGDASKAQPKFLKGSTYQDKAGETRRGALAAWIVSPDNPYTSKALANRYWGWFLGRGFVSPVDDFSSVNIASVPAALDLLASDTAAHGFDLKRLIRIITATRAYQTSTATKDRSAKAIEFFSAGPLKPLTPQQSFDALNVALGVVPDGRTLTFAAAPVSAVEMSDGKPGMRPMDMGGDGAPAENRAKAVLDGAARNFFKTFDDDEGGAGADFEGTVPQGLFLLNSQVVNGLLSNPRVSVLPKVISQFGSDRDRVRHLFLRTLAREPSSDEMEKFTKYVRSAGGGTTAATSKKDKRRARMDEDAATAPYADILWVLVSSSEFGSNH